MLASMSSEELSEWVIYNKHHPLPDPWQQTSLLAALIYNANFKGKRMSPSDFYPGARPKRVQSAAEQIAIFKMIGMAMEAKGYKPKGEGASSSQGP